VPSILVELDDATFKRLNEIAPSAKRQRSEFVRSAVKDAIRRREFAQMRAAYLKTPDTETAADDWSGCEEFKL
jgi:predicted transcriptional regulator